MNPKHLLPIVFAILTVLHGAALADDCAGISIQYFEAPDTVRHNALRFDRTDDGWRLVHLPTDAQHVLDLNWDHAHFDVFTPSGERHLALVEASAEHRLDDRVLVVAPDGTIVLRLGLDDLFPGVDLEARVSRSISHLQWLDLEGSGFEPGGTVLALRSTWGDTARVDLSAGKLLEPVVPPAP